MFFKNRDLLKDLDVSQRDENSFNGKKGVKTWLLIAVLHMYHMI